MNALETNGLTKSYRGKIVLDNVSMSVRDGEIYGLIGRNGAGKTTLIRAILGLAQPDSGTISIFGETSAQALQNERKRIGSIIDSPALSLHLSAMDNMKAIALACGRCDVNMLKGILTRVGLDPVDPKKVKNFSLGMKQRLAIAIALIGDPHLLILDEPVNGLDPAGIFEVRELIKSLNRDGVTVLISSHLLTELGKVATSYGILENGRLVKELRNSDIEKLCRPYIKVIVGDLKTALNVIARNYREGDFEVLPYNAVALYDLSKDVAFVSAMFANAGVPILNISMCEGDPESAFISLMGGTHGEASSPVFEELDPTYGKSPYPAPKNFESARSDAGSSKDESKSPAAPVKAAESLSEANSASNKESKNEEE